jgi:hypothetical protein
VLKYLLAAGLGLAVVGGVSTSVQAFDPSPAGPKVSADQHVKRPRPTPPPGQVAVDSGYSFGSNDAALEYRNYLTTMPGTKYTTATTVWQPDDEKKEYRVILMYYPK